MRGRYMGFMWGGKGSSHKIGGYGENAKRSGLQTFIHEMENVGHEFPTSQHQYPKTWINETVVPGMLTQEAIYVQNGQETSWRSVWQHSNVT